MSAEAKTKEPWSFFKTVIALAMVVLCIWAANGQYTRGMDRSARNDLIEERIARLPIDNADKFCQWLLESFNHNGQTVMLAPATGFYGTPGLGKNEVRLAYVLNLDDLSKAMDCLEAALKVYPGRTKIDLKS